MILFIIMPFVGGYVGYEFGAQQDVHDMSYQYASFDNPVIETKDKDIEIDFLSEEVIIDLSPIASGSLRFNISSQEPNLKNLFGYHVISDPDEFGMTISLLRPGSTYKDELLKVYQFDGSLELESFIEELALNEISISSGESVEDSERNHSEYLVRILADLGVSVETLQFSDYCKLTELPVNSFGNKVYLLEFDSAKFNNVKVDWGYVCGVGKYLQFEDIIVANYGVPVDASDAKVIPYTDIQFIP